MKTLAIAGVLAAFAARAEAPEVPWATLPEVVAFAGHAAPEAESWLRLGPFTLVLVCPSQRPCRLFLLDAQGAVDPRSAALAPAAAATGEQRPFRAWLEAVKGGGAAVMAPRSEFAPPVALVTLDARGAPRTTVPAPAMQLTARVMEDDPPGLRAFRRGRVYTDLLGPAPVAPQVAVLPGGRWVLGLVTTPATANLACAERRLFVVDARSGTVHREETARLGKAVERALSASRTSLACAYALGGQGETARLRAHTGGKAGFSGAVDIGPGPGGGLPLTVLQAE